MITDDERREVARRLRENAEANPNMGLLMNFAFADDSLKPDGQAEWKVTSHDAAMRLADLIEPDTTTDTTKNAQDTTKCDRDALLELADDLGNMSDELPPAFRDMGASIAHRIRGALGIEP